MEYLNLQEVQKIELKLLCAFRQICEQEGLRYSLGGGTLLGAVRHKGFIPWDDDIDVSMPRKDYDRFLSYCMSHETPFDLYSYLNVPDYFNPFSTIADRDTVIEDENILGGRQMGISIDVFPVDGLGNSEEEANKQYNKSLFLRERLNAAQWQHYFRSKTHSLVYEPIRFGMFLISRNMDKKKALKKLDRINNEKDFDQSEYVACVCGSYRRDEIMTRQEYQSNTKMEFEGETFSVIDGYDAYLTKHYGDYMQLPPEEKRQTHHTWKARYL